MAEWHDVLNSGDRWCTAAEAVAAGLADRVSELAIPASPEVRRHAAVAARTTTQRPSPSDLLVSALVTTLTRGPRRSVPSAMATLQTLRAHRASALS